MSAITVTPSCREATIAELGARDWPIWSCGVSRFPWTSDLQATSQWDEQSPVRKHYRFG